MTSGMPELGSKISLISKADIRYEGRLFTVDPQECTIALASVRSYGTEDRETQFPVPAQNQVYDYILFRGSDIKDIRVVNNVPPHAQPLNDPAIMQLSVPPSLGGQQFQSHPVLGPMGPQMGQFGAAGAQYGGALGGMGGAGGGLAPGMHMQRGGANGKPSSVLDLIAGGSRSTTPASFSSRKSPTSDQATQAGHSKDKKMVKPIQPPGQRNQQRNKSRERKDSRGDGQQQQQQHHQNNRGQHMNRNQQQQQHHGGGHQQANNYHHQGYNNQQHGNQQQQQQQQRGNQGWTNRGPMRPRGRPRGGGFKPNQGQPNAANKGKNTLKFDNDYDFEQANTEFEELRSQLAKVKIDEAAGSTSTTTSTKVSEVNGDVDKKDDSGNETGAGETEQEEDHDTYYDKTKSFFDKISCEAVERAKGKSQRTDWRTERKLNSETFGVSATRRGNYRGRGGFRGMGFRGGYRGGYRQPQRRDQQPGNQRGDQSAEKTQGAQNTNSSSAPAEKVVAEPPTAPAAAAEAADTAASKTEPEIVKESTEEENAAAPKSNSEKQVSVPEPAMAVI